VAVNLLIPYTIYSMKFYTTLLLYAFFTVTAVAQYPVLKVKHDATGLNNGTSWGNAFTKLSTAIQSAHPGDSIWVAQGVYFPTTDTNRDSAFMIKDSVCMFGGFNGSETILLQRNVGLYKTILSGDIGVLGDSLDNSFNVMRCTRATYATIIDGFTIRDGNANNPTPTGIKPNGRRGAGVYLRAASPSQTATPTFRNCHFYNNSALGEGGGLFFRAHPSDSALFYIESCRFQNNRGIGGDLYGDIRSNKIFIKKSVFKSTTSQSTSAISFYTALADYAEINIDSDTFSDFLGTAIYARTINLATTVNISNSLFKNNINGTINCINASESNPLKLNIDGCTFEQNELFSITTDFETHFSNNIVKSNKSFNMDVGKNYINRLSKNYFFDNTLLLRSWAQQHLNNNVFIANRTSFDFSVFGNSPLLPPVEYTTMTNCLFYRNVGSISGKMLISILFPSDIFFKHCTFINCVGATDTTAVFELENKDSILFNSCVFYNTDAALLIHNQDSLPQYVGASNCVFDRGSCAEIIQYPKNEFCSGLNLYDAHLMFYDTAAGDFRLLPCSDGVNFGDIGAVVDIPFDLNGNPRIANGIPDAGAFETELVIDRTSVSDMSCHGNADGAVTYSAADCFAYTWLNTSNGTTGSALTGLNEGTYHVTITGANLTLYDTFSIAQPPVAWSLTYFISYPTTSTVLDGDVLLEIEGGTPPYKYHWENGITLNYIEQLPVGIYKVTVSDANGCTEEYTFELNVSSTTEQPDLFTFEVSPNPVYSGNSIAIKGITDGMLTLHHTTGAEIAQIPILNGRVQIPATLAQGIYVASCTTKTGLRKKSMILVL
jgi:hypothetical protein